MRGNASELDLGVRNGATRGTFVLGSNCDSLQASHCEMESIGNAKFDHRDRVQKRDLPDGRGKRAVAGFVR